MKNRNWPILCEEQIVDTYTVRQEGPTQSFPGLIFKSDV